jgi:glycosyltransferase involved in cell wall biosynthesis
MSAGDRSFWIGIDGRELEGKPTGVGSYLRNILLYMDVPTNFRIVTFFKNEIPEMEGIPGEPVLLRSAKRNFFWQNQVLIPQLNQRKVDLFFTPSAIALPAFQGVQVAAIHDLSYFNYPDWFGFRERVMRRISAKRVVKTADRIYVISNHVRNEILKRFGISSGRILLTPVGVQQRKPDPSERRMLRQSYGYDPFKLVLYVGSIFQRRHLPIVIASFKELDENVKLAIIGENRTYPKLDLGAIAEQCGVRSRVIFLEYATSRVLEDYYKMADAFIYLSTYEGFGIPPLEAMSYGVPTVVSRTPAMDEVYEGVAQFAEIQTDSVVAALRQVLTNSALRESLIQAGLEKVQQSNWRDTAALIVQDWECLLAARS